MMKVQRNIFDPFIKIFFHNFITISFHFCLYSFIFTHVNLIVLVTSIQNGLNINFIVNKIKSCTIRSSPHPHQPSNPEHKVNLWLIQAVTKSNQPSSVPGPGDYNVVKPLPKSATIAQTTQKR